MTPYLLLDIDGTLLNVNSTVMHKIVDSSLELTGLADKVTIPKSFSGRTDADIFYSYLSGLSSAEDHFLRLKQTYISTISDHLLPEHVTTLPFAEELALELIKRKIGWSLMTGNFQESGFVKMKAAGLHSYLPETTIHIFGDEHRDRVDLAGSALPKLASHYNYDFTGDDLVVVGDTPNDIRAAQAHNYRSIGVLTGNYSAEDFKDHQPDELIHGLDELLPVLERWYGI